MTIDALRFRCVSTVLIVLCTATLTVADWSDNFNGALQQGWVFGSVNATQTGESASFTAGSVDNRLQMADSVSGLNNGAGVGFGVVPETFSDVSMSGIVNPGNDGFISPVLTLIARADVANSQFYAAEVNYNDSELVIFRNDSPTDVSNLITAPIADLAFEDDIYVEFLIEGSDLTATAFDMPGGTQLANITANDTTYTSGLSGVLVFNTFGDNLLGVWDDLTAIDPSGNTGGLACDSDQDQDCDQIDINAMYAAFGTSGQFDYDANGTIGSEDIDGWLADASNASNTAKLDPSDIFKRGDVNLDGNVDSTDLGQLLNKFSSTSGVDWIDGDLDGDDAVASTDLGLLLNNFGHTSVAAAAAAVPEPSSLSLVGLAFAALLGIRRRR